MISNASRPIIAAEIEACQKAGITYIELPVAYDGLAVVVNPKNTWATSITVAELKKLWEPAAQGKVMRWNQIRASWPDQEVHLFGAGVDSGTFDYFTEVINGKAEGQPRRLHVERGRQHPGPGRRGRSERPRLHGLAYYEENKDKMKLVAVDDEKPDNGAGPILPSVGDRPRRHLSAALAAALHLCQRGGARAAGSAEVRPVLRRLATPLIKEVGYVPLADAEQQLVRQRFAAKTTGTMFGAALDARRTTTSKNG